MPSRWNVRSTRCRTSSIVSLSVPHTPGLRRGFAAYAVNPEAAARLWQVSLDMIGNAPQVAC
ncbi:hypothetical protein AB0H88_15740 [Nonomuraea sp. NPDC050680]|uniref:hypothetical protein n=1 Tax=Nonomuraea sp. NPDC050680 TaxID=3154630 RepID=UPI0033F29E2E